MLNRSLSASEFPTRKRILIEEQTSDGGNTIMKHISCEQISYSGENVKIERVVHQFRVSCKKEPITEWNSWQLNYEGPSNVTIKESNPKENKSNLNFASNKLVPLEKKTVRPLSIQHPDFQDKKRCVSLYVILPVVLLISAIFAGSSMYSAAYLRTCELSLNIELLKHVLESDVYGQEAAINKIIAELSMFVNTKDTGVKILVMTGGIGVGKSYTASLISEHFPWEDNIQQFVIPVQSLVPEDVCSAFSECGYNLLVVDGLQPNDTNELSEFLHELVDCSKRGNLKVIVLLVFSMENHEKMGHPLRIGGDHITAIFINAELEVSLIEFEPLQQEHVEMCIEESFSKKGMVWSSIEVQQVLNLLPAHSGCKGVSSKVQLISPSSEDYNYL